MLARVAERLYWMARYVERAESLSRMLIVHTNMILDLPKGSQLSWQTAIEITGNELDYLERYDQFSESGVMQYLISDIDNQASIASNLRMARENIRTSREVVPADLWEIINQLYLSIRQNQAPARSDRYHYLQDVVNNCQRLTGVIDGCMSRNIGYQFIELGRNIERTDMTTRIIDTGVSRLLSDVGQLDTPIIERYESLLWMSVLQSLSAYQMYRLSVADRVNSDDVIQFLLVDDNFPRSVLFCLYELERAISGLSKNEDSLRTVVAIKRLILNQDLEDVQSAYLHDLVDKIQAELAQLGNTISETWFLSSIEQTQTQSEEYPVPGSYQSQTAGNSRQSQIT